MVQGRAESIRLAESILGEALQPLAADLRLVDVADYIAFIRLERLANIKDIIESALELSFRPGTLVWGAGADYELDWGVTPIIIFDLEFRHGGVFVRFNMRLDKDCACVSVQHLAMDAGAAQMEPAAVLRGALHDAQRLA